MSDVTSTIEEHSSRYGRFVGNARIAQDLKRVIAEHTPLGHTRADGTRGEHLADDQQ
jgi:hypothetical protein